MKGKILTTFLLLLAGYAALLLLVYVQQPRMLFLPDLPSRRVPATPASIGLPFEELTLTTDDGLRLHGWFLPAQESPGVILFHHGNAGNLGHRLDSLKIFHQLGWSTLIFDYRGYGLSEGHPSEPGTYRDAEAAWRHLVEERGVAPERIVLFGRSLGGAVAAHLAEREHPGGVILESTFTSVPDRGAEIYPYLPVRLLARYRYDTLARLPGIDAPLLVVHSRNDEIIPFHHGERLFAAANAPKSFLEIQGDHNGGFLLSGERYRQGLTAFLSSL